VTALGDIGGDLAGAISSINVPSYVIDPAGVVRWVNPAAEKLVGDVRGRQFTSVVAPEETRKAREAFARKIAGTERVTDGEVVLLGPNEQRVKVDISSVPLVDGHRVVGVFGQVTDVVTPDAAPPRAPSLTPRQHEILHLLNHGKSTHQIATELHLSPETVRNHVRRLLRALGVHSRLEAVALFRPDVVRPDIVQPELVQ
jgi:PAS domain S-box-containing protein